MHDDRGGALPKVLLTVVAIVLLALAAYIPYALQQHRINDLNSQITSLRAELAQKAPNQPSESNGSQPANTEYMSSGGVKIILYHPSANAKISNPVAVIGEVPGNWSFEASFPIKLEDGSGNVIAQTAANVLGNWMTTDLVPFSAQFTYSSSPSGKGTLVLQKDNPSGLPANDDQLNVPVEFG